jgi:superfamily II DNA helicase RecQ
LNGPCFNCQPQESRVWRHAIGLERRSDSEADLTEFSATSQYGEPISVERLVGAIQVGLADKVAEKISAKVTKDLKKELRPVIQEVVEESLIKILGPFLPLLGGKVPWAAEERTLKLDDTPVAVPSSTLDDLRRATGKQDAEFKSPAQAQLLQLLTKSEENCVAVIGTGGGKTFMSLVAAKLDAPGSTTLIVCPTRFLVQSVLERAAALKLTVREWLPEGGSEEVQVLVLSADRLPTAECRGYLQSLGDKLKRIVFDEAHLVVEQSNFRVVLKFVHVLMEFNVPIHLYTATAPPGGLELICNTFHLRRARLIRSGMDRPEVEINVVKVSPTRDGNHMVNAVRSLMDRLKRHVMGPEDRGMIFCHFIGDADRLERDLLIPNCHRQLKGNQSQVNLDTWLGTEKGFIATTSVLSAGVDFPSVNVVIHYGMPNNILSYVQELGRGGRRGQKCHTYILWDRVISHPEDHQSAVLLGPAALLNLIQDSKTCRRYQLTRFMDGTGLKCADVHLAELCDVCRCLVPPPPEDEEMDITDNHVVRNAGSKRAREVDDNVPPHPHKRQSTLPAAVGGANVDHLQYIAGKEKAREEVCQMVALMDEWHGERGNCEYCMLTRVVALGGWPHRFWECSGWVSELSNMKVFLDWAKGVRLQAGYLCYSCWLPRDSKFHVGEGPARHCLEGGKYKPPSGYLYVVRSLAETRKLCVAELGADVLAGETAEAFDRWMVQTETYGHLPNIVRVLCWIWRRQLAMRGMA